MIEIQNISAGLMQFAGVKFTVAIIDVDDGYSGTQLSKNGTGLTNLQFGELLYDAIQGYVLAASIRVKLSSPSLFPARTITVGDESIIISNANSSTVVVSYPQLWKSINGNNRLIGYTYGSLAGLGTYVYSPLMIFRVDGDNDRILYYASSNQVTGRTRISASEPFGLAEELPFPSVLFDEGTVAASSGNATLIVVGETSANINPLDSTDPYLPDGVDPSTTGGGTGTFSETGDTIGIPGLPTLSAVDTGFITLFNPSATQVKSLAAYMWSSSFDLATFKNIVANPIDCILGLSIVPVNPPNAGSKVVTVGNIPTDVTLPYLSSQYVEVDCGTLNVQEFWGSYLDYSPYTKMSLYLPYIGIIPLDIDDVMNASIAIKYHVDVLSGACVAYVLCNGTQLYTYVGQCSSNVPITSNDFTNTVNGILGIAGSIGKLAADGGASAPTEAAGIAANAINALKPNIQKSGAMSGTGGLMGVQTPYLICQRPRQSVPASQNTFTGYPANITATLSDLSGYTEVESIHLDGLSATQEEQQEIMDLLTSGVII